MDTKKPLVSRGDIKRQQAFVDAIKKEDKLRLKWFRTNEQKLMDSIEKPSFRVTQQEREELKENRRKFFKGEEKHITTKVDMEVPPIDTEALMNIMRPVDPETKKLLYNGMNADGRVNYLRERIKIIPEKRYYLPETTSFIHGWNMWDYANTVSSARFGKSAIIRQSFYRRRGAERDPDWYRAPAQLSPTVCNNV